MKPDGTVNRSILPTIFNPDDMHALEMALSVKDRVPGSEVIILTMGPKRAADIIREGYYRGVDMGYMISDRRFGGADTLATSYTIAQAIKKIGGVDMIFGGVQAIDGDTAQVGPQTAEKVGFPQVTFAEELVDIDDESVTIKRRLELGVETVVAPLPVVVTVNSSAPVCRPREAKRVMKYKYARTGSELQRESDFIKEIIEKRPFLSIPEWGVEDLDAELPKIGLAGSPTIVHKVENIVLTASEAKVLDDKQESIDSLIIDLLDHHIIG